jgi:dTDP-D-glucose 4,6-dehydratase
VRGRNSDNTRLKKVLAWEPSISLEVGLEVTYKWIEAELRKAGRLQPRDLNILKANAGSALA